MQYEAAVYFTFYRGDITYKHSLWGFNICPPRHDIDLVRQFMDDIEPRLERVCGLTGLVEGSVERIKMGGCEDSLD